METDVQFSIELRSTDGQFLCETETGELDLVPAREAAILAAAASGGVSAVDGTRAPRFEVEPVWNARYRQPFISGFRVWVSGADGRICHVDFGVSYFGTEARRAAQGPVRDGRLKPGESFYYLVKALPRDGRADRTAPNGLRAGTAPVRWPLKVSPLGPLIRRSRPVSLVRPGDIEIFVHASVLEEAVASAQAGGELETGGVLVGFVLRDADTGAVAVEVTGRVAASGAESGLTSLRFTAETWVAVREAIARRGRGEQPVGFDHAHMFLKHKETDGQRTDATAPPTCRNAAFFSEHDIAFMRVAFPRAYSVGLVVSESPDPWGGEEMVVQTTLFGWREGEIVERGYRVVRDGPSDDHSISIP